MCEARNAARNVTQVRLVVSHPNSMSACESGAEIDKGGWFGVNILLASNLWLRNRHI